VFDYDGDKCGMQRWSVPVAPGKRHLPTIFTLISSDRLANLRDQYLPSEMLVLMGLEPGRPHQPTLASVPDCSWLPFDGTARSVPKKGSFFDACRNRYELTGQQREWTSERTPELSDHGQRQDGLVFRTNAHRCPWFAPVILLGDLLMFKLSSPRQ
jgi:hypothetical protein